MWFAMNGGEWRDLRVSGAWFPTHPADKEVSRGDEANAVAQHGNLVYVLNVGGNSNVVGFRLNAGGTTSENHQNRRQHAVALDTKGVDIVRCPFSDQQEVAIRTEGHQFDPFSHHQQFEGCFSSYPESRPGCILRIVDPPRCALVSETGPAGGNDTSAISSYSVAPNGTLVPISTGVLTLGNANCWNAVSSNRCVESLERPTNKRVAILGSWSWN